MDKIGFKSHKLSINMKDVSVCCFINNVSELSVFIEFISSIHLVYTVNVLLLMKNNIKILYVGDKNGPRKFTTFIFVS